MRPVVNSADRQMASFTLVTLGWMLSMMAMGHAEWRIWYVESTSHSPYSLACVGMWKVCIYRLASHPTRNMVCHLYTHNVSLPVHIRVPQNLLLAANILVLVGRALTITTLRNMFLRHRRNAIWQGFVTSGILHITAGMFILVTVIWNYHAVMNKEGITFPPSFHLPFKPVRQKVGNAILVAALADFIILLSGLLEAAPRWPNAP
ncbi:claudin-34 [Saccopteryx bilineata]|uniref:claudin-34 n=1 Tax=Saccopteryx bilineata TaxID=59482 RepID=UPI00338F6B9F